jgi:DnaJ like chaperone protein
MWWGKIIGGFLGFSLMGPFGLLLGLLIGHQFDLGYQRLKHLGIHPTDHLRAQSTFFRTTFQVMGYVAKADGHISENEIRIARQIMSKMGLSEVQRQAAIRFFTEGKQAHFNLDAALSELKQVCQRNPILLHVFVELQTQAAYADGHLTRLKVDALQKISQTLGARVHFADFREGFAGQQYRQSATHQYTSLDEAYALLAVEKTASNPDVKRAYRRQMSQNHPDKLVAKGLPESMMKLATEKTQKIKAAYDQICAARGI